QTERLGRIGSRDFPSRFFLSGQLLSLLLKAHAVYPNNSSQYIQAVFSGLPPSQLSGGAMEGATLRTYRAEVHSGKTSEARLFHTPFKWAWQGPERTSVGAAGSRPASEDGKPELTKAPWSPDHGRENSGR